MAGNFISAKSFFRDVLINLIAGLVGAAIAGVVSGKLWLAVVSFVLIVLVIFAFWLWGKYKRTIRVLLSGIAGYYFSFDLDENPKVWDEAKTSFCYLGISSDSIMEPLRRWLDTNRLASYRILMMKPHSDALRRQEAFQIGHDLDVDLDGLPPEVKERIDSAAEATSKRIEGAVSILKNTTQFGDGRMRIRLYDEFSPWWAYLIDNTKTYVGILEKGKRGSNSPVVIMKRVAGYASPFDAYLNHFERLWHSRANIEVK